MTTNKLLYISPLPLITAALTRLAPPLGITYLDIISKPLKLVLYLIKP